MLKTPVIDDRSELLERFDAAIEGLREEVEIAEEFLAILDELEDEEAEEAEEAELAAIETVAAAVAELAEYFDFTFEDEEAFLDFTPVDEFSRTYIYADGAFTVEDVSAVCVRPSGTHRLETLDGRKFIVPAGWIAIEIEAEDWSF